MHNYLHELKAGSGANSPRALPSMEPAGDDVKWGNGPFSRKIKSDEFAISVEMLPPHGTSEKTTRDRAAVVAELGRSGLVDAVDVTDGSRGVASMPPGDFVSVVREQLGWTQETGDGLEFIPHFTTRDLNVMGLQSRLIGYHARRMHNVLFTTGDPPKMSPEYPRSSAVFDLDSIGMVRLTASHLNAGTDFGGQPLGRHADPRTHFTVGSGFEPEALNMERELDRLREKIDAGADYIMTQPAFRYGPLEALEPFRPQVAILVGVMVLTGLEHARRSSQIPGVVIPKAVYDRLGRYSCVEDQRKAGVELAIDQVRWVRERGWAGLYLMSTASFTAGLNVLRAADPGGPRAPAKPDTSMRSEASH